MTRQRAFLAASAFLFWSLIAVSAPRAQEQPRYAGSTDHDFLLPNGWTLKPAGRPVALADLPLNIIPLAGNRHALAATSGYNAHELAIIDLHEGKVIDRQAVNQSWFGLAATAAGDHIWWSGGGANVLHAFDLKDSRLTRASGPESPSKASRKGEPRHFRAGIAFDAPRKVLYSLDVDAGTISALTLNDHKELKSAPAGSRPYDVALSRSGNQLFVSDWAGRVVRVIDPGDLRTVARIAVGDHPNQIAVSPTDDRIFVACASSNWVSVIDTRRGVVTETIHTALFPRAPEGSTPDARSFHPMARPSSSPTPITTTSP